MSKHEQVRVGSSDSEVRSSPPSWLMLPVGLVVGAVVGFAFTQSPGQGGTDREADNAANVTVTTLDSSTSTSTDVTSPDVDAEELQAELAETAEALSRAEKQILDLGLRFDPVGNAPTVDCDASMGNHYDAGYREDSYFVGPVGFHRLIDTLSTPVASFAVFAGVEGGDSVTLVVPERYRGVYALLWTDATAAESSITVNPTLAAGVPAVTLSACASTTVFAGGFVTASRNYCAPLDVYFGDSPEPERVILPFDGVACPDGSMALVEAEAGPLPDVVGLTLRDARLAIRRTDLIPRVNVGDPLDPTGIVWGQEPNDGSTHQPGTTVGLRTCLSGADLVASYQERLDGTGITLEHAWLSPSLDPRLEFWAFVSVSVSGGVLDNQIATWALPRLPDVADTSNTPGLSIPANAVAEGFEFGDRRFTAEFYGVDDWLEVGGVIASQRCVEISRG